MCDCVNEVAKKLEEHALGKIQHEHGFQGIESSGFENAVYLTLNPKTLEAKNGPPFSLPFIVRYKRKSKAGNVREYKKTVNFFPSFCPVCGEKYAP